MIYILTRTPENENMKVFHKRILGILLATVTVLPLSSCGGGDGSSSGKSSYTITCTDGKYYDISSDYRLAPAGTVVTVTVEAEAFLTVERVLANNIECTAGNTENTFTFTMPQEDVDILAIFTDAPEISDAENGMRWILAPSEISLAREDDGEFLARQNFSLTFGSESVLNNTTEGKDGYATMLSAEVISTNENVIPSAAISNVTGTGGDAAYVTGAEFSVDLTQVGTGTATLVFFDNDNGRIISRTITVVPYGEVFADDIWTVSVNVDFSGLNEADKAKALTVWFSEEDSTYVYGSAYERNQQRELTYPESDSAVFEFIYRPEGTFRIQIGYRDENSIAYLNFVLVSGTGENGFVTFEENGAAISVQVKSA